MFGFFFPMLQHSPACLWELCCHCSSPVHDFSSFVALQSWLLYHIGRDQDVIEQTRERMAPIIGTSPSEINTYLREFENNYPGLDTSDDVISNLVTAGGVNNGSY
jgi:hypothetical protein